MAIARGYAITGDVQTILFERNFLENDLNDKKPGSVQIEGFIDTSIDRINATLKTVGYTIPILLADSPVGYYWVKNWNAVCAAEQTARRAGSTEKADELKESCQEMHDSILDHSVLLTDVPGVPTDADLAGSGTSDLTDSGDTREPFFTRAQTFACNRF